MTARLFTWTMCALGVFAATAGRAKSQVEVVATTRFGDPNAADWFAGSSVSPGGRTAVLGQVGFLGTPTTTTVRVFAPDASLAWSAAMPRTSSHAVDHGDVAFDASGDLLVLWVGDDATGRPTARATRFAQDGAPLWTFEYPCPASDFAAGNALAVDASGSVYVAGEVQQWPPSAPARREALVFALSPLGTMQWDFRWHPSSSWLDAAELVALHPSGDVIAGGWTRFDPPSPVRYDFLLIRLSPSGALRWVSNPASSPGASWWSPVDLVAGDTRIAMLGDAWSDSGPWPPSAVACVVDANSPPIWSGVLPNPGGDYLSAGAAALECDGALRVTATSVANGTGPDGRTVMMRLDPSGQLAGASIWAPEPFAWGSAGGPLAAGAAGDVWTCSGAYVQQYGVGLDLLSSVRLYDGPDEAWNARRIARTAADRLVVTGEVTHPLGLLWRDLFVAVVDVGASPHGYCTAKTTANGCVPRLTFEGSASASSGFTVRCTEVRNEKFGLFFYGLNGASAAPFQGGTMCVQWPVARTPIQSSGGNAVPADDCSGVFAIDMNAFAAGALGGSPLAGLSLPGTRVWVQLWGRDPGFAPPNNSMLSSALRYEVLP